MLFSIYSKKFRTFNALKRQYAKLATYKPVTEKSNLSPNDIPQITSVARGGKAADVSKLLNSIDSSSTEANIADDLLFSDTRQRVTSSTVKPITSLKEFSRQQKEHQSDIKMLDSDLKLLSALLGRPITIAEIPSLVGQIGRGTAPTTVSPPPKRSSGTRVVTSTTTTERSTSVFSESTERIVSSTLLDEAETVQELLNVESTTKISPDFYGKTNEAKIAAILRQQGIGPANNNIPVEVSKWTSFSGHKSNVKFSQDLLQQIALNPNQPITTTTTTTRRPRPRRPPTREPRPILDGLAWLWQTWQETAPRQRGRPSSSALTSEPQSYSQILGSGGFQPASIPQRPQNSGEGDVSSEVLN